MINGNSFIISYFSSSDKAHITRHALWNDQCKYWISKAGRLLCTYWDIEANGYRIARDSWKIKSE